MTFALEDVEDEVVSLMEPAAVRVVVVPPFVVHRNPHLLRVAVVQAVAAPVVILTPEILGVVNIGIVVKPIPIPGRGGTAVRLPVRVDVAVDVLGFRRTARDGEQARPGDQEAAERD